MAACTWCASICAVCTAHVYIYYTFYGWGLYLHAAPFFFGLGGCWLVLCLAYIIMQVETQSYRISQWNVHACKLNIW